jgi:dihydroceramidase
VTSSIDWCELNYDVTVYICEFSNCLSSGAIMAAGVAGLALHWRVLETRFALAFLAIFAVGLGSVGFHATLHHEWQMADEVPMLWSALIMTWILIESEREEKFGPWLPVALFTHGCVVTAAVAISAGNVQFYLFHLSFGSLEFFSLWRVYQLWKACTEPHIQACFRRGFGCYGLGLVCWTTDLLFCEAMRTLPGNPQLHAWWHIFVSGGLYMLCVLVAYERCCTLGLEPQITYFGGCLPIVERKPLQIVGRRMTLHAQPANSQEQARRPQLRKTPARKVARRSESPAARPNNRKGT